MTFWLFVLLYATPSLMEEAQDPLEGWFADERARRNLECTPISVEQARALAPGEIAEAPPRGDRFDRRAVVCRERLLPLGVRRPQDDAILGRLRETGTAMSALIDTVPELAERTWLVEAFHPNPQVAYKIAFATKNGLLDRGRSVSDRAPKLTAGDLEVIGGMSAKRAFHVACARYSASRELGPDHALLAVILRDARETRLHAGVCADGQWRWLR